MTKLEQIERALDEDSRVMILGKVKNEDVTCPGITPPWKSTINIFVAPSSGGFYSAKELQELMMSLVPEIKPDFKHDFVSVPWDNEALCFGRLYFDEDVEGGRHRTWVSLFPNKEIAVIALSGGDFQHSISLADLAKYGGPAARH